MFVPLLVHCNDQAEASCKTALNIIEGRELAYLLLYSLGLFSVFSSFRGLRDTGFGWEEIKCTNLKY